MCTLNMYRGPLSLILIWHNSHLNLCHSFYGEISQTDNNLFVHTLNIINHNALKSKPTLFKHIEWQFINAATCCTPLSLGRPILKTFENEELSHITCQKRVTYGQPFLCRTCSFLIFSPGYGNWLRWCKWNWNRQTAWHVGNSGKGEMLRFSRTVSNCCSTLFYNYDVLLMLLQADRRITLGGCLFFSRWKNSAQPKKLEQEHFHHIENRPLLNLFMNFNWVLRNTLKTQNGHWTICHCFLKEFISDIITILQKFEFLQLAVLASCIFVLIFLWLQRHPGHVAGKGNRST